MKKSLLLLPLLFSSYTFSATLDIEVEVPKLDVVEYHKPYVAGWIEDENHQLTEHVFVWYQMPKKGQKKGEKWLKDLRRWWRKGGRELNSPVDGLSGATRPAGKHQVQFTLSEPNKLAAGNYTLFIEAAREAGGREVVKLPFSLPIKSTVNKQKQGKTELGTVTLVVTP